MSPPMSLAKLRLWSSICEQIYVHVIRYFPQENQERKQLAAITRNVKIINLNKMRVDSIITT